MRHTLLVVLAVAAIIGHLSESAPTKKDSKRKPDDYEKTLKNVAENIEKASKRADAIVDKHMSDIDEEPGAIVSKKIMQNMMQDTGYTSQKAGTRSILIEAGQGFNGVSNFQPSSWKITETMSGPTNKNPEPSAERQPVYTYPAGLGPVLLNQCTAATYDEKSPCYNSKLFDLLSTLCRKLIDAANYIGVGFDGRGYYRADSRRGSLIQRACSQMATFMGQDVPDTMNVYGIFETVAETKTFLSVDEYMDFIQNKAGLSNQKNLFTSEAKKCSSGYALGINFGGIGAAIGARYGDPSGAAKHASIGGSIGLNIAGGWGSGSGEESSTDRGNSSSKFSQTERTDLTHSSHQNLFAVMFVNVVLYEISLDKIQPTDINLAALRDYMSLPVSYFSAGADIKYQNFLLRWGTHFIRSAKFGGQLKITKTAKADKIQSAQEFASIAETEFQSMFATLQAKWSQKSVKVGFLGLGGTYKDMSQSGSARSESNYESRFNAKNENTQDNRQSEFTQTAVEAQGGTPEIAEALVDFYTPAFKQLFHDWILSIKDYAKPFEFQLRPINELFNLNMDALFPAGNTDFGCVGGGGSKSMVETMVDPKTNKSYYIERHTEFYNNVTVEKQTRVDCLYKDINAFQQDMERRSVSLERAVGIYMTEGPFPTSSFEVQGGEPGCEEATLAQFHLFGDASQTLPFSELKKHPFIIAFDLPAAIPDVVTMEAKYAMTYRFDRWFAVEPNEELVNLYDGCQIANVKATDTKVCFRNIILTYEETTGFFHITDEDFAASLQRNPWLPYWLSGTIVARASSDLKSTVKRAAVPCNVQWLNSHRLDPTKPEHCIHFTAASEGDLFVIFASIPKDHSTWYYLQITSEGANFYHSMKLWKSDLKKGIGMLGDKNLFQSFFVCVIQQADNVTMQYGKADPDSEVGSVYAAYTFPSDSHFSRLTFYSFGSGNKPVSLMDIRRTKKMPEVSCHGTEMVKMDGKCVLDCHPECDGCNLAKDSKRCHQCRHVRLETMNGDARVVECLSVCPPGMFSNDKQVGNALCEPCPFGSFGNSSGMSECEPCAVGYFANVTGLTSCLRCPANSFSERRGSNWCSQCSLGYYQPDAERSNCSIAPEGFFVSDRESGVLKPCPIGTFNGMKGQSSIKGCLPCPAGTYSAREGSTSCELCPKGHYQPDTGKSSCVPTDPGFYADSKGQKEQKACPDYFYSAIPGAVKCDRCTTDQDITGSTMCSNLISNSALCTKTKLLPRLTLSGVGNFPGGRLVSHDDFQTSTYHSNMNCSWKISPPTNATRIRLIIRRVNLEMDLTKKCSLDNLTIIFENAKSRKIERFVTCYQPATFTSSSTVTIQFRTDGRDEKTGFLLEWFFIPADCNCASRLGCFKDLENTRNGRDLPVGYRAGSQATVPFCRNYCRIRGFRYVGVQSSEWCYCGNSYGRHGRVGDSECKLSCKGNGSATCGGYMRNEIFETGL